MPSIHPEIEALRERMKSAPMSLRDISDDTGLGWHWLRALAEGRIRSPGYDKVTRLRAFLDEHAPAA